MVIPEVSLINPQNIMAMTASELSQYAQRIGNTPLLPCFIFIQEKARKIHLKLEGVNPTGSVKDRTGYSLIRDLEQRGMLRPRTTIIESTSGNLGVALSFLCKAKGYSFVAVIDPKTTQENIAKMQAFGAAVHLIEQPDTQGGYLLSRLAYIRELCQKSDRFVWTNQYENPVNPLIHYTDTGPEIYRQMHGKVDAIFIAVSTGGTLAGVSRFFREVSPSTRIIGVDAHGSVIFGTPGGSRKLTGIGSSRPSSFLSRDLYDAYILVGDEEAFTFCRSLHSKLSLKLGGSSGAVVLACARYLLSHPEVNDVVCLCADSGENYKTSIFDDEWIQRSHLQLSRHLLEPVQDIFLG